MSPTEPIDLKQLNALRLRLAELTSANADLRESLAASEATVARLVGERDKAVEELNSHVGKQALKEMIRQMLATADERDRLRARLLAAEALAESRRLALGEVYEAAEQWHHSVEWEGQEYTGKVMAICTAALAATGSTALAELKRGVRVETLREWANGMECHNSPSSEWIKRKMLEHADAIAAGTEVEDATL